MLEAGTAKISVIQDHWNVSQPIARRIIANAGLIPVGDGPQKYWWKDIWRLEGEVYVPPVAWNVYKAKLLTVPELPALDEGHERKARTWRRYVEQDQIPVIRLTKDIVRIRRSVFLVARHHV